MIGIYRRQPRALTIKKNKIKCILLESPLGLKGKRVNFSPLLPSWHFYSVLDHSWCPAERAEKIRSKPHLGASPVCRPELRRRPGRVRRAHASSPFLCLASQGSWGAWGGPVPKLAAAGALTGSGPSRPECEVGASVMRVPYPPASS